MDIKISFGSRWAYLALFDRMMDGSLVYLHIEYGHNSTRNLIRLMKYHTGKLMIKWRDGKFKMLRES